MSTMNTTHLANAQRAAEVLGIKALSTATADDTDETQFVVETSKMTAFLAVASFIDYLLTGKAEAPVVQEILAQLPE